VTETHDDARANDESGSALCDCKIGRTSRQYGIEATAAELERLWTGTGEARYSVRDLAEYFNRRVLRAEMEAAGMDPLDGEVANTHRLLTDTDVSSGVKTQARRRLEREGVHVDGVTDDLVSHQTVYHHLTNCREVEYEEFADDETRLSRDRERLQALRNRTGVVTEETVSRLRDAGVLDLAEFEVLVDVQILCEECGTGYDLTELLGSGGCSCSG